ncbi:hypothetical protein D3C80_1402820 [compost metagenome]
MAINVERLVGCPSLAGKATGMPTVSASSSDQSANVSSTIADRVVLANSPRDVPRRVSCFRWLASRICCSRRQRGCTISPKGCCQGSREGVTTCASLSCHQVFARSRSFSSASFGAASCSSTASGCSSNSRAMICEIPWPSRISASKLVKIWYSVAPGKVIRMIRQGGDDGSWRICW